MTEKRMPWWRQDQRFQTGTDYLLCTGSFHYTWSQLDSNQYNEGNLYYTTVRQTLPLNSYDLDAEQSARTSRSSAD